MISSSRLGKIWRMLGPIAFVNSSRSPNAEYVRNGSIIECQTKRDMKHFFGYFNSECLCPLKSKHGDPFSFGLQTRSRKRKRTSSPVETVSKPAHSTPKHKVIHVLRKEFPKRDPRHRLNNVFDEPVSETTESSEASDSFIEYREVFGEFEQSSFETQLFLSEIPRAVEQEMLTTFEDIPNPRCDVPEEEAFRQIELDVPSSGIHSSVDFSDELFPGSQHTAAKISQWFDSFCVDNALSQRARSQLKAGFQRYFPKPKFAFQETVRHDLNATTTFDYDGSKLICANAIEQIKIIVNHNWALIERSWSETCEYALPLHSFAKPELLFALNLDGVQV